MAVVAVAVMAVGVVAVVVVTVVVAAVIAIAIVTNANRAGKLFWGSYPPRCPCFPDFSKTCETRQRFKRDVSV